MAWGVLHCRAGGYLPPWGSCEAFVCGRMISSPTTVVERNGYRINEGLYPDVRLRGGGRTTTAYRVTAFRHIDEAAKSRRLPRGWMDIGSGVSSWGGD